MAQAIQGLRTALQPSLRAKSYASLSSTFGAPYHAMKSDRKRHWDSVVIGAGVIGLSSALQLQEAGHAVTILARDFPHPTETADPVASINYTSLWGGAHNRFVPPLDNGETDPVTFRDHGFSLRTQAHMTNLATSEPSAGVTCMPAIEYIEASPPPPEYAALDVSRASELGIRNFRLLRADELPEGVSWGCGYDTWCVNPMVYCAWLLRRFAQAGGKIQRKELRCVEEVWGIREFAEVRVVVNCSGVGFNDPDVFITRGQTCLVAEPCNVTVTRQNTDGTWTFCVPRGFNGGTIIGGTKQPNDWTVEPSLAVREELLAKFVATYPAILPEGSKSLSVRADVVGRRPTRRGGLRLERETVDVGEQKREVVHAYGLGGRGFELSWGVAEAVRGLVSQVV